MNKILVGLLFCSIFTGLINASDLPGQRRTVLLHTGELVDGTVFGSVCNILEKLCGCAPVGALLLGLAETSGSVESSIYCANNPDIERLEAAGILLRSPIVIETYPVICTYSLNPVVKAIVLASLYRIADGSVVYRNPCQKT